MENSSVIKSTVIRKENVKYTLKIPRTGFACLMLFDYLTFYFKNKVPIRQVKKGKRAYHIELECSPDEYGTISSFMNDGVQDLAREYTEELANVLKNNLHNLNGKSIEKKNSYRVYFCEKSELSKISKNIMDFISIDYQK